MNLPETLGFVGRNAATGGHTLLPLGLRVRARLSRITRDGLTDRGANTVACPTLQSRAMWQEHAAHGVRVRSTDADQPPSFLCGPRRSPSSLNIIIIVSRAGRS
ncbi:hypothetical protein [Streptomyces sp. NPDC058086]|uniref:hypothetical protein n=1 Tax=Streptomyces sp. NPDC058086 TaxID=3346334 RepID=UPI0036E3A378